MHPNYNKPIKTPDLSHFWVIAVISNPVRYLSRYRLYRVFEEQMLAMNTNMLTVEMAFGDRDWEITQPDNPRHIRFRSWDELWHKENMINLAVQQLWRIDPDWQYVAWVDADVNCLRVEGNHGTNWLQETWHQLQHYHVVQMFSHAIDLGPNNQMMDTHNGFMYLHVNGKLSQGASPDPYEKKQGKEFGHPGYAWACDRYAWTMGFWNGLVDFSILGAGDHHMARALIGEVDFSIPKTVTCPYLDHLHHWQDNALQYIKKDVGYVPATIVHSWHGKKRDRGYIDRWKILVNNNFDPVLDLKKDWQGLYQLTDRNPKLRDQIRQYMRSRNEDSIDIY